MRHILTRRARSPTSGGQYHWVSEFSWPRYQRFLSYITGELGAGSELIPSPEEDD